MSRNLRERVDSAECPCGITACKKMVGKEGLQCECCCEWFHVECAKLSTSEYNMLSKKSNVHWFCDRCNGKMMEMLSAMNDLRIRTEKLENEFKDFKLEISQNMIKQKDEADSEMTILQLEITAMQEEITETKKSVEMKPTKDEVKVLIAEGMKEIKDSNQIEGSEANKPSWGEIVSREVDTKLLQLTDNINLVQTNLKDSQEKMTEIADKQNRKNNVIIYNAEESKLEDGKERMNKDKMFCEKLMNTVLQVGYEEGDVKKVVRLGKRSEGDEKRPLLVEFKNDHVKNLVMENAGRLGKAKDIFKGVSMSHDMTLKERKQCKEMVAEAKLKQSAEVSGDWIFKVRGQPGSMKVWKVKRF